MGEQLGTVAGRTVSWSAGQWTNQPAALREDNGDLVVSATEGSDAWRTTSYGFIHDSEHSLLTPMPQGSALEVTFTAAFEGQFDQAGLMLRADRETWIKAGLELADGSLNLGGVVTLGRSDWSIAPVPHWAGRRVTVRASRTGDAVKIRAGIEGEPMQLVRIAPFPAEREVAAGPYCCAPTRSGLEVRFHSWRITAADVGVH